MVPIATEFIEHAFRGLTQKQVSMLKDILGHITGNLVHKKGAAGKARSGKRRYRH